MTPPAYPQPGRSAGTHSQAGSANPQPSQAVLVPPARKKLVSLVPAVTVIPDPLAYIKVVAVKAQPRQAVLVPSSQEEVGKYGANSHSTGGPT